MNHEVLQELPELYVLGALAEEERQAIEAHLPTCQACAASVRELLKVTEGLGIVVEPRDPPARLRERVLSAAQPRYSFLMAAEGWKPHAVPGVSYKELAVESTSRQATLLVKLAPDTHFPGHHHSGHEQCLVLAGDLRAGGRRLGPGDFHRAEAGSDHEESYSEQGCTVILIVSADDYLSLS